MHQLLLATRNPHKTREFAEILGDGFKVRDLTGVADLPAIAESGLTFEANAILKAVEVSRHFDELVVVSKWRFCKAHQESIRRVMPVSTRLIKPMSRNSSPSWPDTILFHIRHAFAAPWHSPKQAGF